MSVQYHVFVHTENSFEVFIDQIESIFDAELEPVSDQDYVKYFYNTDHWFIAFLWKVLFENEGDLNFEDYRYDLSIGLLDTRGIQDVPEFFAKVAREVFEKLKATRQFRLMLTFEVDEKLEEYDPGGS